MHQTYYIDGYNVLHHNTELEELMRDHFEVARDQLIDRIVHWCAASGEKANIIFDGQGKRTEASPNHPDTRLVEILFSVGILFMLMGLLFVGFHHATNFTKRTANIQTVSSLKTGIALFQNEFGFLPPLVKDDIQGDGPLTNPSTLGESPCFEQLLPS